MRLKAEIWVKAYLRACATGGVPAVVVRHGDDDAGAVYIKISRLDGTARLFGPAPVSLDEASAGQRWASIYEREDVTEAEVDTFVERQFGFDPDLWLLEIEDKLGRHFLDDWLS